MFSGYSILTICAVTFFAAPLAAQSAVYVPLEDASFEGQRGAVPSQFRLSLEDGATGRLSWTTEAHTGKRALLIEKTNDLGVLMLTLTSTPPAEGATLYEAGVYLRVKARQYGSAVYFRTNCLDAGGTALDKGHDSPILRQPNYSRAAEWRRHWSRWTSEPGTKAIGYAFRLEGNAVTLVADDFELIENPRSLDRPGTTAGSTEPPYDETRARANLAKRVAEPGRVVVVSNRPMIAVGDRFRGVLLHNAGNSVLGSYSGFGRAGIHLQTVGCRLMPVIENPDHPDFRVLEKDLLRAVGADPEVRVVLRVAVSMPRQWGIDHPDEVWGLDGGMRLILPGRFAGQDAVRFRAGTSLNEAEMYAPSFGSQVHLDTVARALRVLGNYVRTSDVGKIVAGISIIGGSDGQFYDSSQTYINIVPIGWIPYGFPRRLLDHGPGHTRGFQNWLREIYRNDVSALKTAWGDPKVTFETAAICEEKDRWVETPFLLARGPERRTTDSQHYSMIAPARMVKYWAQTLEQAVGRPLFAGTYYAGAAKAGGGSINKYALLELLSGPDHLDMQTSVNEYHPEFRGLGGTGGVISVWGASRLRGVLQICEHDYRTHRSPISTLWHTEQVGQANTPEEWRAQIRRDMGASASRGMGAWFYDMTGGWFDEPKLWETVAEANRMMEWTHRPEAPSPVAETAVFVDEDAGWRISETHLEMLYRYVNRQRIPLNLGGAPYDMHMLDDIRRPDLPEYKAYIFLTAFTLTEAQVAAIKARCRKPGKVVVFVGTPGLGSPDYANVPALVQDLTDIRVDWLPEGSSIASLPVAGLKDPIAAGLTGSFIHAGKAGKYILVSTDADAVAFGRYIESGKPSHVIKRTSHGIAILIPPPQNDDMGGLTPQLVNNIARLAGAKMLGTPGQVFYAGSGVAICHRVQPGPAELTFAEPVDLFAPDAETVLSRRVTRWTPTVELLDTALVLYRPSTN